MATDDLDTAAAQAWAAPDLRPETLAFLQYTSGSTSTPKGVMVSHGNLMANERMMQVGLGQDGDSNWVGWLPMFHDMGLIGTVMHPLFNGAASILMSPMAFVQEPIRWLQAITRYRAQTSGAPNFAYDLCAAKISSADSVGLDLSSWTVAFNGSEPVRPETIDRFVSAFEPVGFRRETMYPCYGLAEATLFVSGPVKSEVPVVRSFEVAELEQRRARPAASGEGVGRALVGCGQTWLDQNIVIANPGTLARSGEGEIGEIWISGENVAQGYWNRDEATTETFRAHLSDTGEGPFLRTGDLGFFDDGELFISGRIKDLIIIRGRNHYPQDIERTVESSHPILRPGCGAAFSVDVDGEERLAVVQEVSRKFRNSDLTAVVDDIRQAVTQQHDLAAHAVVLIKPGHIPKTSSGKIQRHACRQGFLAGSLDPLAESVLDGARTAEAGATSESSLLQQTLRALGPENGRALMESHIRGRASEFGGEPQSGGALHALNAIGLERLHRAIETDLGMAVGEDLVRSASNVGELATNLIALVIDPDPTPPTEQHTGRERPSTE